MIIYQAAVFDNQQNLGDPEKDEGIFISLNAAKTAALEAVYFIDEEPLVYAMLLHGEEFQTVGVWWRDRTGSAPVWKYREENDGGSCKC